MIRCMTRSRVLLITAVLVVGISSCGSARPSRASVPAASHRPAAATWALQYDAAAPVRLATDATDVVLAGKTVIYPYSDRAPGQTDRLASLNLSTGRRTDVARTDFRGGAITAVVRAGNKIVYIDESNRGQSDPGSAHWRVVVAGSHRVLASSGGRRVTMSPDLLAIDGVAVWTTYPDQRGVGVQAFGWKPGGKVQHRDVLPGAELECTPSTPKPEQVGSCDHRNGWIAWTVHPEGEAVDDASPANLFIATEDGSPRQIAALSVDSALTIVGDYLLWDDGDHIRATSFKHPSASTVVLSYGSANVSLVSGDDHRAVVLVQHGGFTTLRVLNASDLRLKQVPAG